MFKNKCFKYFFTFSSLRQFQLNGIISKLKHKHLIIRNSQNTILTYGINTSGEIELSDIVPTLTMVAGSIILALLILIAEKIYYSFEIRSKNKLLIKKSNHNLDVRNRLRKGNNDKNLKLQLSFNNTRLIGY